MTVNPESKCDDKNCPKHGNISVRGMRKTGKVMSAKTKRTAVVEMDIIKYLPKYKRWAKDKSRVAVHRPECMSVEVGDEVLFEETRKISKTKSWVITRVLKKGEKGEPEDKLESKVKDHERDRS